MERSLSNLVNRHIRNTPAKGYVKNLRIKICEFPHKFKGKLKIKDKRVYINTKSLKHLYDVRSAKEFNFIISNVERLILNPIKVFKNKEGKTGDVCFYNEIDKKCYFCIVEVAETANYLVSVYKLSPVEVKRKNYLSGYKLLWSWKVDLPSS